MRAAKRGTKPRTATLASFPVPTAGLITNRNLALPTGGQVPPGAAVLENWFPTPQSVVLRRGLRRLATTPELGTIRSVFTYTLGSRRDLFVSTDTGIWNATNVPEPFPQIIGTAPDGDMIGTENGEAFGWLSLPETPDYGGFTSGDWSVVQYSTIGNTFLIGVNGHDTGFIYDGTDFWPYIDGGIWDVEYSEVTPFSVGEEVTGPIKARYPLENIAGAFTLGETVTGGNSGETATILAIEGVYILVGSATGDFTVGEEITGSISAATADIESAGTVETPIGTIHRISANRLYMRDVSGVFASGDALTGDSGGAGTAQGVAALIAPGISGIDTARFSFVWVYNSRIWFIERDSLNAWYLPVDQVGGVPTEFPMGGVFQLGGSLLFGQSWSLDSGNSGGLSDQCIFVTTEGEVAAYQGLSPDQAATWSKVGIYRIGTPLGKSAFIRAGGDIVVATSIGFIPLGNAIQRDYAALGTIAISNPISDTWRQAVTQRGLDGWKCVLWAEGSMVLVTPPTTGNLRPVTFVTNSDSGAWSIFTGWNPTAFGVHNGRLIIGSENGAVQEGWVTGSDEGVPYTGSLLPLFNDLGAPGQRKIAKVGRVVSRSNYKAKPKVTARFDWDVSLPAAPDAPAHPSGSLWDVGTWNESIWDSGSATFIGDDWVSLGGSGYASSVAVQVTSASLAPIDMEIIRLDYSYDIADIIT